DRSWFNQYYWDMKRGWLWGSGEGGVSAYDVNTGVEVRFFQNQNWPEARFVFSPDNTQVVVYSIAQPGSTGKGAINIYDIDSQAAVSVNVEGFAAPDIPLADYDPVALSADNRYLAVGYDAIRVWDIQNLPEKVEDRLPIYRHAGPKTLIWSLRFSDAGVIETNSKEGIQHWDLHTGQFLAD
ncbi:MAG: WD40 repeat domain-containing protein, partial [Chloroflexota bacterium]